LIVTFQETLYALGVREDTLSDEEKDKLDQDGFLPLANIISAEQADDMRTAMAELFRLEKTAAGGPSECSNMQNKSDKYDVCFTHPRVLAAIAHVLKEEFISLGVHSRPNPPGKGLQPLHVDYSGPAAKPGEYFTCNSMWPLTDFTEENGATRVVPGSHLWGKHPKDALADPNAPHPEEIKLIAPVGTVVIFNSHLWHGATLNRSLHDRPNVTSFWCRRRWHDNTIRRNHLSPQAFARLSEAARRLFDPPSEVSRPSYQGGP
jgi:ectoine hydroxylase-related dioxygenase (phytanoyl-CoA dioxygenase family)